MKRIGLALRCTSLRVLPWLLLAVPARAQEPVFDELPDSVARTIVALHNARATTRFTGEVRIAQGTAVTGAVAVVGGPVVVAGRVEGALVVINGDLRFEAGAAVTGPIIVVGGRIEGAEQASLAAGWAVYLEPLRFRQDADGLLHPAAELPEGISAGREFGFGRTDLFMAVRSGYNRVEGLPIAFGPRIRFGNRNPTALEGLAIYRSASGLRLDSQEMGYAVRLEQFVGGRRAIRIGLRYFSEIAAIEDIGLTDRENSLATFLLHRDYRDSYETDGWSAYLRVARPGGAHDFSLEFRNERHRSIAPANPWSLLDNDDAWRPNPIVAEGVLRSVVASLRYDTRNETLDPATGWDVSVELEQGLGGGLDATAAVADLENTADDDFRAATFDLRRYVRLTPYSRLAVRAVATGSLDGDPLPAQRQKVLGGEATLPGYRLMEFDCGARTMHVEQGGEVFFPYYGCDRVVLVQLEYQAGFPFARRLGDAIGIGIDLGQQVRWAAFFDAGRAWNEDRALDGRTRGESDFSADAGLGIRIGQLGFYWTVPLSGSGQGLNFFVRIGRRL